MKILATWFGQAMVIAVATVVAGWWTVPIVGALWAFVLPRRGGILIAVFSGAAAWGLLLLILRVKGPVGAVDRVLAGTLQMPPGAGVGLTLVFAALLAGSAAMVAQSLRPPEKRNALSSSKPST
jgi:hypothetical protein